MKLSSNFLATAVGLFAAFGSPTSGASPAWEGVSGRSKDVWRQVGPGPGAVEAQVIANPATHTVYVSTNGGGVLKSTDHGLHFSPSNTGLATTQIQQLAIGVNNPNTLY